MADYISRQRILNYIDDEYCMHCEHSDGVRCENCHYEDVRIAIKSMPAADVQPVNQWISVKDRQPQEGGFYLTYYVEHIHVSQWFPSKNWYNEHGGNVTNMVEYWQPLPEPPNE